jgi:hypothetical protein
MDLFLYHSRTDNSKNLENFKIFNIAKIGYVLRVISLFLFLAFPPPPDGCAWIKLKVLKKTTVFSE